MIADRAWVIRNLGFDPVTTHAPISTFANPRASLQRAGNSEDLQREIIDFDSEGPEGLAFFAFSKATGLSRFTEIPWPKNLAPKTDAKARKGKAGALPKADVLVVTWTVDEGHALSRVLTPGKDSRNDYVSYKHNFARITKKCARVVPPCRPADWGLTGPRGSAARRSLSSSPTRTCRKTPKSLPKPVRRSPTRMYGGRSSRRFARSS